MRENFAKTLWSQKRKMILGYLKTACRFFYWLLKVQKVFGSFIKTFHLAFKFFVFKEMIVFGLPQKKNKE